MLKTRARASPWTQHKVLERAHNSPDAPNVTLRPANSRSLITPYTTLVYACSIPTKEISQHGLNHCPRISA